MHPALLYCADLFCSKIKQLPTYMQGVLRSLGEQTGWGGMVVLGGPAADDSGNIEHTVSVFYPSYLGSFSYEINSVENAADSQRNTFSKHMCKTFSIAEQRWDTEVDVFFQKVFNRACFYDNHTIVA